MKKKPNTKNATILKLHGTPFKSAADLKANADKILMEEWQNVERARVRRELLMRDENKSILKPLMNGMSAKFVGPRDKKENLVRVYLTDDHEIQIDIDHKLKGHDVAAISDSLVKSLVAGLVSGYLGALGLIPDGGLQSKLAEPKSP